MSNTEIKNDQIIKLGSIMLGNPGTLPRGVTLLNDLANLLLPELTIVPGPVVQVPAEVGPGTSGDPTVTPTPLAAPVNTAQQAPALVAAAPPAQTAAPAAPVAMTPEELNAALVVEFHRLKSRDGIVAVMAQFGAASVNDLAPAQYQPLLTAVQSLV